MGFLYRVVEGNVYIHNFARSCDKTRCLVNLRYKDKRYNHIDWLERVKELDWAHAYTVTLGKTIKYWRGCCNREARGIL